MILMQKNAFIRSPIFLIYKIRHHKINQLIYSLNLKTFLFSNCGWKPSQNKTSVFWKKPISSKKTSMNIIQSRFSRIRGARSEIWLKVAGLFFRLRAGLSSWPVFLVKTCCSFGKVSLCGTFMRDLYAWTYAC